MPVLRLDGSRAAAAALAMLLAAAVGSPCVAATLHGTVVDPQDRAVAGAAVRLTCGEVADERTTDPLGTFRFERPADFVDCTITADATGFRPALVQPVDESRGFRVHLRLPILNESLTVRPSESEVGLSAYRSLASVSIPASELRDVSDDTHELVRYARARAGLSHSTLDHVYVDGLPASTLPPADTIERIVIDGDPFSVEYADGSEGHIDVATASPDRRLRWSLGGSGLGLAGRSVLDGRAASASSAWRLGLSGPVPHLPLTFSAHSTLARDHQEVPVRALPPAGVEAPSAATVSSSSGSIGLALHYSRGAATRASVSVFGTQGRQSNFGVSGVALPEAGMRLRSATRELRATFATASAGTRHRGGLVGSWSRSSMEATSPHQGVSVSGVWTGGGAEAAFADVGGSRWAAKYVAEAGPGRRFWRAGATFSRHSDTETRIVNPAGRLVFESPQAFADARAGLGTGTWFGARGGGRTAFSLIAWSSFAEVDVVRSTRLRLRAGLRADHQSGAGTLLSPRLSGAATGHGATLRWGGGVFVRNWSPGVLLQVLENDRSHLERFLAGHAALGETQSSDSSRAVLIDSRIADDLARPRDLVLRASVERSQGSLKPGIEYTWTRTTHRLGSRRLPDDTGWVDTLESNRFGRKTQLHIRLETEAGQQGVSAHYRWTRSRDDTSGPFSFPASQHDLAAEVARTAGVAPHEISIVGRFRLPGEISLTLVEAWHSSTPYNVTTGTDPGGLGLYTFRGDRRRNSGDGPGYHCLSLYASRRMALPLLAKGNGEQVYANVSLRLENLLDDRNHLVLGSVAGSPLLGTPLAARPGRALRVSVSFDH